jgi:hypothetical protein
LSDLFELASTLLMLYTAGISFYVAKRAAAVGLQYLLLSLLLALMALFHGAHHLFAYLQLSEFENSFEFGASILALALAINYSYVSRRP